jgi:hypothetical protein
MEHSKNCAKNTISCLVDHQGSPCPGFAECTCKNQDIPPSKTINEIEKIFDGKFPDLTHVSCGGHTVPCATLKSDLKLFLRQSINILLEEMRKPYKNCPHTEPLTSLKGWNIGYNDRNAEINKHLDNLLSKGEI